MKTLQSIKARTGEAFGAPLPASTEAQVDAAAEAAASGQSSSGMNKPKSKNAAPVAFLLGGSPRN